MSRWIDADALEYDTEWDKYQDGFTAYSQLQIDTAPSIDLVFCKECRHRDEHCGMGEHRWCRNLRMTTRPDDFCSYGERKDDE